MSPNPMRLFPFPRCQRNATEQTWELIAVRILSKLASLCGFSTRRLSLHFFFFSLHFLLLLLLLLLFFFFFLSHFHALTNVSFHMSLFLFLSVMIRFVDDVYINMSYSSKTFVVAIIGKHLFDLCCVFNFFIHFIVDCVCIVFLLSYLLA
jgi:hypothetical protein